MRTQLGVSPTAGAEYKIQTLAELAKNSSSTASICEKFVVNFSPKIPAAALNSMVTGDGGSDEQHQSHWRLVIYSAPAKFRRLQIDYYNYIIKVLAARCALISGGRLVIDSRGRRRRRLIELLSLAAGAGEEK